MEVSMSRISWIRLVGGVLCGAMALALLKYLFDTYSHSSIVVALLSSLLVIATLVIPCLVHRRRCARAAQQPSPQISSQA
jgi:membrane protein YdbS with pleckstrin-like domain